MIIDNQTPELLTLKKTSETLKVHPNTLRKWDKKGILKSVRFGDRKDRYYRKEDILNFIDGESSTQELTVEENDHSYISYTMRKTIAEQALERLNCIQLITSALSRALTPKEVIDIIVNKDNIMENCSGTALLKWVEHSGYCKVLGSRGFAAEVTDSWEKIPLDQSNPFSDLLNTGEPVIIESSHDLLIRHALSSSTPHITANQALALLPLFHNNAPFGILILSFSGPQKFSREDISFMFSLARQCSLAWERALLYLIEKKARYEAEEMATKLERVHSSSLKFLAPLTKEETFRTVVEEAMKLMGADYGSLFLNINGRVKKVYTTFPLLYKVSSRPQGFGNTALTTNRILINQINENEYHQLLYKVGIKTILYIPLSYENKTIGLITLNFLKPTEYQEKEESILRVFGSLASLAIERINLPR